MVDFEFPDMPTKYLIKEDQFQFTEAYPTPEVTIPEGLITDGASVPRWLQGFYPAYYKYFPAAAVHDYMYGSGLYERKDCDRLFRDNMRYRLKLSWRYWFIMWVGVRIGGASRFTARQAEGNTVTPA
jgi:hypothetical protein